MDTSSEEGFGGVDVAHPYSNPRIHQVALHRPPSPLGPLRQNLSRKRRREGLESEMTEVPVHLQSPCGQSKDQPESPRIAKSEPLTGIQVDADMLVRLASLTRFHESQPAAHSEVHYEGRAPFGVQQEVFRPPVGLENSATEKPAPQGRSIDGFSQCAAPHSYQPRSSCLGFWAPGCGAAPRPLAAQARWEAEARSQTRAVKAASGSLLSPLSRSSVCRMRDGMSASSEAGILHAVW